MHLHYYILENIVLDINFTEVNYSDINILTQLIAEDLPALGIGFCILFYLNILLRTK